VNAHAIATRRPLIPLEDAREIVLSEAAQLDAEDVDLLDSHGRVLAKSVTAIEPVPPFDNSAMDGFAVRAVDTAGASEAVPIELGLVGESRAGRPASAAVSPGEAIAISTGAVLPDGADSIVPLEDARRGDDAIEVMAETTKGRFVRHRGDDIETGEQVLAGGTTMGAAELGVLGSLGITEVACTRRPRVALLINGDELADPGARLQPGQIHDSNGVTLRALARLAGAQVASSRRVQDDLEVIRRELDSALDADLAVVSGGVSVGEHDHVKEALGDLRVRPLFWGVALRPGRPTWFGIAPGGTLVFGLPGNPVSAMVCFILLVRPLLMAMQGADPDRPRASAILDRSYSKLPGRAHAVRCTLELREDGWHATPTRPEQASHVLTSMLGADVLALIPADSGDVAAGERVEIELLS
jgi:molybdopterin molybdotransferase